MRRRDALHIAGAAGLVGLTGCTGFVGDAPETLTPAPGTADDCPLPTRLAAAEVDVAERYCTTPGGTPTDARTAMVPGSRTASLPDATVEFTLTNRRERGFNTQFAGWDVHKLVDGAWHGFDRSVVTVEPGEEGDRLPPGGAHTWTVSVDNDDLGPVVEAVAGHVDVPLRALGGGTYAFVLYGSYGDSDENWAENRPVTYGTRWQLDGDPLELVSPDSVTDVTRDGDEVTVQEGGSGDPPGSTLVLTRTDPGTADPSPISPVVVEAVYGRPPLRAGLAAFEDGVRRVVVDSSRLPDSSVVTTGNERSLRFRGTEYLVERPGPTEDA